MEAGAVQLHATPGVYAALVVAGLVITGFALGSLLDRVMGLFGLQIDQVQR